MLPNHALINEYHPGSGIMAHTDGPRYYPFVCILSLSGPCMFQFWKVVDRIKQPEMSLIVHPRSLLVFTGDTYSEMYHSIEAKSIDDIYANE